MTGVILLSVGLTVQGAYHGYKDVLDSGFYSVPSLLIAIGSIIFFIAFFGCCGAIKENYCMTLTVLFSYFWTKKTLILLFSLDVVLHSLDSRIHTGIICWHKWICVEKSDTKTRGRWIEKHDERLYVKYVNRNCSYVFVLFELNSVNFCLFLQKFGMKFKRM